MQSQIYQRHFVAGKDRVVPKDIVAREAINADSLVVIPSYDDHRCWTAVCPAVLAEVEQVTGLGR